MKVTYFFYLFPFFTAMVVRPMEHKRNFEQERIKTRADIVIAVIKDLIGHKETTIQRIMNNNKLTYDQAQQEYRNTLMICSQECSQLLSKMNG